MKLDFSRTGIRSYSTESKMGRLWQSMLDSLFSSKEAKVRRRQATRRALRVEMLERRQTMDATISGVVFHDVADDGFDVSDPLLSGVSVALFRDGGNGTYDNGGGDDVAAGTTTSAATTGAYSFTGITTIGTYFVVQTSASGSLVQRSTQRVQTVDVNSISTVTQLVLDNFDSPVTNFVADSTGTNPNFNTTSGLGNAEGGVRDLHATASAGILTVSVDGGDSNALDLQPSLSGDGVFLITYDGDATNSADALGTSLGAGTNNFDMTQGGTADSFLLFIGTEAANATITIRVSGVGGTSTTSPIALTVTGSGPLATLPVPFTSLTGSADLTQIGAIQFEINQDPGQDTQIDSLRLAGPSQFSADLVNLSPMTIGNLVFLDRNNDGTFNGTDTGISGVDLLLYEDTNGNGVLDSTEVTAQPTPATTTTNASGIYTFTGLVPGDYIVFIPATEFATNVDPLFNHITSPGAGPVDTNNEDQGAVSGTGVAAAVTLAIQSEPTNDGDTDNNTNLTVDFGFTSTTLALTKTDSPDPVSTGQNLTYTLTATNNGPSNATNTIITDTLPTGLTFVSANYSVNGGASQAANNASGTITTGTFTLTSGQSTVLTIIATVGTGFANPTTNTGSVDSAETTPVTANASTTLTPDIDLGIVKTIVGGATTVGQGGTLTYRLALTNNSSTTVTGIEVFDNFPLGFTLGTLPSGVAADGTTVDPNDVIWSIASLAGGATTTVDIPVTVSATAALGLTPNTATIDVSTNGLAGFNDTVSTNNTSTVNVTVEPRYDLRITKTNNLTALATGQTFTYTLTAINDGPSSASNVTISDTLPSTLEFISSTAGSATGQTFTANVGTLISGASSTGVDVVVRVRSSATGASIANTATVTADNANTQETSTSNNSATDTDPLTRTVTLNITKDDSTDPVIAGGANFDYIITAFNSGNADTPNTVVTDVLPTGLEFVSGTFTINESTVRTGTLTFDSNTRTVTGNLGTLLPGSSTTNRALITLTVRAAANAAAGQFTNTARIVSTDNSTGVTNDETTTINRSFDVTVTKSDANTGFVAPGQTYTYTIVVTNTGTSTATNISVSDPLPSNLTFVSATSGFTNNAGTVTGTIPSLAAGSTSTLTITTTVNNNAPNGTVLTNTVTVAASGESNTGNNTATETATVQSTANLSGIVYIDSNNNGVRDTNEAGIAGVVVTLTGTPTVGSAVSRTATTDSTGAYAFTAVPIGTYTVVETQPADFTSRSTNVGTINSATSGVGTENQIASINLTGDSINNNFGEILVFSKRRFLASSAN
jgi:uncharacterized repeat protein (TIGR01451 family)